MSSVEHATGCPECGGRVITRSGERRCSKCGLVTDVDSLDRGPEWRGPIEESRDRRRTGAPLTRARHDRGLSTEIGYVSGADVPEGNPRRVARMRREHNRAQISTKAQRNRVYGFTEIRRICSALELPRSVRERSCVIFERAQTEGLFQGRSLEGFAAAGVYASCRIDGVARTRREVIGAARADENEFRAAYDAINREMGLPIAPVDPRQYLPRLASRLGLDSAIERDARGLAGHLIDGGLVAGRKPGGVAAACLYAAAVDHDVDVNQRDVSAAADVSPVTLRGVYHLLKDQDVSATAK